MNIGSIELADAQAFYDRYIGPDNAVLVVTGAVDEDEARRLISRYFTKVRKLSSRPRRMPERPQPGARYTAAHPTRRLLYLAFAVPGSGSVDDDGLSLLAQLVSATRPGQLRKNAYSEKQRAAAGWW